jgi:hypothetical protein
MLLSTGVAGDFLSKLEGVPGMAEANRQGARKSALTKALENEKGAERPTVYKGFYIYADQYVKLLELSAQNKIKGIYPSSSSDMIRLALDKYLGVKS